MIDQLLAAHEVAEHNDSQPQFQSEESKYDVDAAYAAVEVPKEKLDEIVEEPRAPEDGEKAETIVSSDDNEKTSKAEHLALSEDQKKDLIEQSKSASGALMNLASIVRNNLDKSVVIGLEERHQSPNIQMMTEDMLKTYQDISNVYISLQKNGLQVEDANAIWNPNKTQAMLEVMEKAQQFKKAVSSLRTSLSDPLRGNMTITEHRVLDSMETLINNTERQLSVFRNRVSALKPKS